LRTHGNTGTGSPPDVEFNNNIVDGLAASNPFWDQFRAVQIQNIHETSLGTFYGNNFTNSDVGVFIYDNGNVANVEFHQNNFIGNLAGVDNTNTNVLDATCNWYGDISGPYNAGLNPSGTGSSVVGNIIFSPWLTDAYPIGDCMGFIGPVTNIDTMETFTTIQAAIDDSNTLDGHEIYVNPGIHAEGPQIHITKNITIFGDGCGSTIIIPTADTGTSGDARGWFLVDPGVTFILTDLELDGTGYKIYQAIRHLGMGLIENVCFTEIKYDESGPYYSGVAIAAFGTTGPVDVVDCEFTEIGRIGVLYYGAGVAGGIIIVEFQGLHIFHDHLEY